MLEETLPDEVCVTSFTLDGKITAVDFISLDNLQAQEIYIPKGVYATAHSTPMTRH